jgi:tetratricopeptide (TPR) repeat protein
VFKFVRYCAKKAAMRLIVKRARGWLLAGVVLGWAVTAQAATDEERATARSLANQAITAFKAKRFGEAADLFQRAESLVHSPVHLLYLGRSYVATGKLVRAQEAFLQATREELPAGAPSAFAKAVEDAGTELDGIKLRLAQLTITVGGGDSAHVPEVSVDGEIIPPVMVGVSVPMEPRSAPR